MLVCMFYGPQAEVSSCSSVCKVLLAYARGDIYVGLFCPVIGHKGCVVRVVFVK